MMNYKRYQRVPVMNYPEREWPNKEIEKAPIWCSVDLRDGNQALVEPMVVEEKIEMFNMLVQMGFKEIEIGFPAASQIEFDFLRQLVERRLIPDDVTVQVLTQCRDHLLKRTFESIQGIPKAVVHIYNSTSTLQRDVVFHMDREEIKQIAIDGVDMVKKYMKDYDGKVILEYSPESFTGTEMDFALDICNAVQRAWGPTPDNKMIINLPSTVEMTTPNVFADQIEWMSKHLENRESIVLSVHPHNDRGTGVAAAELAMLAGADRVEGTLFGNGERTGNVDILTIAYNMFSQGIDPELEISDIKKIAEVYERCTKMHIDPRHPYAGKLVFTAFSGSHQDAINKGMHALMERKSEIWQVPYLPIDPKDIGRTYEAIIRVNSQSGKGGMAYLLKTNHNLDLPKRLQVEFDKVVQAYADETKKEVKDEDIWRLFKDEYLPVEQSGMTAAGVVVGDTHDASLVPWGRLKLLKVAVSSGEDGSDTVLKARLLDRGVNVGGDAPVEREVSGIGNGPIAAFLNAISNFGVDASIMDYAEHTMSVGTDAMAASYVECQIGEEEDPRIVWGVGIDTSIVTSSLKAIISAINRSER